MSLKGFLNLAAIGNGNRSTEQTKRQGQLVQKHIKKGGNLEK
jgi:hypothetical protein